MWRHVRSSGLLWHLPRLQSRLYGSAAPRPAADLGLDHFITAGVKEQADRDLADVEVSSPQIPYLASAEAVEDAQKKVLVETYGCQMNFSDTEIVQAVMKKAGYANTAHLHEADVVLINTCAIRENAESKVWGRLRELRAVGRKRRQQRRRTVRNGMEDEGKGELKVGVLGCMAERLKAKLLEQEQLCDLVAGPDAYRDLPRLLSTVEDGEKAINVILSMDETYADIVPVRPAENTVSAYVSIMRGCNNMCSYCIVPFTRGRERNRAVATIEDEVRQLSDQGFKEVVLLGQNVNSYHDADTLAAGNYADAAPLADGFSSIVKVPTGGVKFAELLDRVSRIDPEMRIRFTSPHPKDFPDQVLDLIAERPNVCSSLHMPAQSGSSAVLSSMRRGYTREAYLALVDKVREKIPGCAISSDFISGFCGETEEDHLQTLSLMRHVQYEMAFMFAYSLREKTHAHRKLKDDVPEDVKQRRLAEVIATFYSIIEQKNRGEMGARHLVLVEGNSKRSANEFVGRTDTNKKVVFPKEAIHQALHLVDPRSPKVLPAVGDYVAVDINATGLTLRGRAAAKTTIAEFSSMSMPPVVAQLPQVAHLP